MGSPRLASLAPLRCVQCVPTCGLYAFPINDRNDDVSGTHSRIPVSSDRQVTAKVRIRKGRLWLTVRPAVDTRSLREERTKETTDEC